MDMWFLALDWATTESNLLTAFAPNIKVGDAGCCPNKLRN